MLVESVEKTAKESRQRKGRSVLVLTEVNFLYHILIVSSILCIVSVLRTQKQNRRVQYIAIHH